MKRSTCLSTMLFCALVLTGSRGISADGYSLKYQFKKGDKLRYSANVDQQMSQAGMDISTVISSELTVTGEGETDDGNLSLVVTYDSVTVDINSPMGNNQLNNPPSLVGKRVRKVIDSSGDQISTENLDTFGSLGGQDFPTANEFLINLPKDEIFLNQSALVIDEDTFDSGGLKISPKSEIEYTVLGEETVMGYNCVKVGIKGGVGLSGEGQNNGMDMKLEGDGQLEGSFHFAPKEGVLVRMESTVNIEAQVNLTGPQTMNMPMTMKTASKMELIK